MSKLILKKQITVGKNDNTADYNTANFSTDWDAIKAAVDSAKPNTQTIIFVKKTDNGIYEFNRGLVLGQRINMKSNITVIFEKGVKVVGTRANDYLFYNNSNNGSNPVLNFVVKGGEFDLNNATNGSGFGFMDTINSGIVDVTIRNGASNGWLTKFGSETSATSTFFGKNNFVKNCLFDTHQGSLEMNLIYNQESFFEANATYVNKGTITAGPIFGLWQNCKNTKIINPSYINCNGFNYYSNSCNYTTFQNIYAENTGVVLQGANISDNTIFGPEGGIQRAIGLNINGLTAKGGVNSTTSSVIQLGAVSDFNIKINYIDAYETGILLHKGNNANNATPVKGRIELGTIKNCNPNNNVHDIHNAILFTKPGNYDLVIEGGEIYDNQTVKTQQQPIFFEAGGTPAVLSITQTAGILNTPTITSGGTGYEANSTTIPITVTDTTGTGAIINATTNSTGVITSLNLINAGTGYSAAVVINANSNNTYSNIRINNSKLISYNGRDSVKKHPNVILEDSVEFNSIRNSTKGALSNSYDRSILSAITDASNTTKGLVNLSTQIFAGKKQFNSNNTELGVGVTDPNSVFGDIGNFGTNNRVFIAAKSSNQANVGISLTTKGAGRVAITNGVAVFADDAAAAAGGLTVGQIYKKADGTLMIKN